MNRREVLTAVLLAVLPGAAMANDWAYGLFNEMEHDFGKVERGVKLTRDFTITNTTGKDVRIKGVRVSCHCTQANVDTMKLAAGESTVLHAVMDTAVFAGSKSVTIFVNFDRPKRAEIGLRISAISTANVAAGGHEIDFGIIPEGTKFEKKLNLDYAGNINWKITGLEFGNANVKAEVDEKIRDAKKVRYELTIRLDGKAPAGLLEDRIRIQTNDPKIPEIVVLAKASIEPKVAVSPEKLDLRDAISGQTITKNVIIKASKPFRITRMEGAQPAIELRMAAESKTTQIVTLTITVPSDPKQLPDHIELITDMNGEKAINIALQKSGAIR